MNAIVVGQPLTPDYIDLVKNTVAKGSTNEELQLFLYQCQRTGLDALARQIYCIKRQGKMVTQVGIDGARLVAQRTGRYAGQDGPYWCGDDGVWKDVWLTKDKPRAAKVNVYLMGIERGTPGVAHWDEYAVVYNGKPSDMWAKMPALMLAKCAEMLALRKAFPQELSGLYAAEEMAQADVIEVVGRQVDTATGEMAENYHAEGDEIFQPEPQRPLATQSRLNMMHALGMEFHGTKEEWDKARPTWVSVATGKKHTSSKELGPEQCDWVIQSLQKRINDRIADKLQTVIEPA